MLINQQYLEQPYRGETALHMAIAKGNIPLVDLLLENGASLTKRCTGNFFRLPRGLYVGELPHSFAACVATQNDSNRELFDKLMEYTATKSLEENPVKEGGPEESGRTAEEVAKMRERRRAVIAQGAKRELLKNADAAEGETKGNSVFHVLVLTGNLDMYSYIVNRYHDIAIEVEGQRNEAKLTPLTLSASVGNPKFFDYLVMKRKITHWQFGRKELFFSNSAGRVV